MKKLLVVGATLLALLAAGCTSSGSSSTSAGGDASSAQGLPDNAQPQAVAQFVADKLKGKKVYYAAGAAGYPQADAWLNSLRQAFEQLGVEFRTNDAQADPQKLVQNAQTLLNGKPDVLILHNLDLTNTANIVKQAQSQGVYTIVINLASVQQSDAFVGGNFNVTQAALAQRVVDDCKAKGQNKVAMIKGFASDGVSVISDEAWRKTFGAAGFNIVSDQAGQYDATKARDIANTVMQQNRDLCAFIGTWDMMMIGAANAVAQAGLAGKVGVYTTDASEVACKAIQDGTMTAAIDYGAASFGPVTVALTQYLLESGIPAGRHKTAIYSRYTVIDKSNLDKAQGACYTGAAF
jgi:ribose transport system substrate-binding protein